MLVTDITSTSRHGAPPLSSFASSTSVRAYVIAGKERTENIVMNCLQRNIRKPELTKYRNWKRKIPLTCTNVNVPHAHINTNITYLYLHTVSILWTTFRNVYCTYCTNDFINTRTRHIDGTVYRIKPYFQRSTHARDYSLTFILNIWSDLPYQYIRKNIKNAQNYQWKLQNVNLVEFEFYTKFSLYQIRE